MFKQRLRMNNRKVQVEQEMKHEMEPGFIGIEL